MRSHSHSHQLKRHTTIDPLLHTPSTHAVNALPSQPRNQIIQQILQMKPKTAQRHQPRQTSRTHKTQSAPQQKTAAQFFNSQQNSNDRANLRTQAKKRVYKFLHIDSRMEQQTDDRVKRAVKVVSLERLANRRPLIGSVERESKGQMTSNENEEQYKIVNPQRIQLPKQTTQSSKPKISIHNLNPLANLPPKHISRKKMQKNALESINSPEKDLPETTTSYRVNRKKKDMSIPDFIKASLGIDRDSFIKVMPQTPISPTRHQPTPLAPSHPPTPLKPSPKQVQQESEEVQELMSTKIAFLEKEKRKQVKISQQSKPSNPRPSKKSIRAEVMREELLLGEICGWDQLGGSGEGWAQHQS